MGLQIKYNTAETKTNKPEYRIKEEYGVFTIQVKYQIKQTVGYLWWKKVEVATTEWRTLDALRTADRLPLIYPTLEKAKNDLTHICNRGVEAEQKPKYHYYKDGERVRPIFPEDRIIRKGEMPEYPSPPTPPKQSLSSKNYIEAVKRITEAYEQGAK